MQISPPMAVAALASVALVIDHELPDFDVALAEHAVVDADVATTSGALGRLDLMRVHTPLLDAAFWVRRATPRSAAAAASERRAS